MVTAHLDGARAVPQRIGRLIGLQEVRAIQAPVAEALVVAQNCDLLPELRLVVDPEAQFAELFVFAVGFVERVDLEIRTFFLELDDDIVFERVEIDHSVFSRLPFDHLPLSTPDGFENERDLVVEDLQRLRVEPHGIFLLVRGHLQRMLRRPMPELLVLADNFDILSQIGFEAHSEIDFDGDVFVARQWHLHF